MSLNGTESSTNRCIIRNTTVGRAWGDGIFVNGHPADISIENVVAIKIAPFNRYRTLDVDAISQMRG